jgi:glucose/arabinose dehydrogenase
VRRLVVLGVAALAFSACSSDETAPVDTRPTTGGETTTGDETTTEETDTEVARGAPSVRLVRVAAGLSPLTHVAVAPGEPGRTYVVEQEGRIRIVKGRQVLSRPFLDIADLVQSGGEQGLLSVAFHPNYERNRLFYVNYTDVNGDTRVVEYRARPEGEPARTRELLFVEQPYSNHNGGQVIFGPDGRLYVGMGDGGSGGDPENRAQDLGERLGKLLSIDVDDDADWRIDAYGLRNPWRFSFDRATGDLYIGDVGQGAWEEINFLPRRSPGLENFGWDVFEGDHQFEDKEPNPQGRLVGPITEYSLSGDNCSVIGGFVYRGEAIPSARGHYFYGDYCSGLVWSLAVRDGKATDDKRHPFQVQELSSFGEDARGELYLVSLNGEIFRLAPA